MSLVSKVFKKVIKPVAKMIPGVGTAIGAVDAVNAVRRAATPMRVVVNRSRGALPPLPPIGGGALSTIGGAVGGAALGAYLDGGNQPAKRRRRGKGITARDLRSFKRVAKLVDKYAKPVHHFRNFKK